MDLSSPKVSQAEKADLCKKYFMFGLAFLPFLWAINFFWFFNEAFKKPHFEQQPLMKRLVILSGIGALLYLIGFISWIVVFSHYR